MKCASLLSPMRSLYKMKYLKRYAVIAFLVVISVGTTAAQPTVKAGFRAGLNFATLQGGSISEPGYQIAHDVVQQPAIGGILVFDWKGPFALQSELLYTKKGTAVKVTEQPGWISAAYTLSYLEVPILAKLQGPSIVSLRPSLYAGPAVSFKIHESVGAFPERPVEEGAYKSLDLGVALGGEVSIGSFLGGSLLTGARYTLGVIQPRVAARLIEEQSATGRNSVFTVSVGYLF